MNEILAIMKKPHQRVLAPDLGALCSLAAHADVPPPRREVAVQYIVGGLMSVLTWWLDRGAKEPPEQMAAAFRSLALHGLGGGRRAPSGRKD